MKIPLKSDLHAADLIFMLHPSLSLSPLVQCLYVKKSCILILTCQSHSGAGIASGLPPHLEAQD